MPTMVEFCQLTQYFSADVGNLVQINTNHPKGLFKEDYLLFYVWNFHKLYLYVRLEHMPQI